MFYDGFYTSSVNILPKQMVPLKEKLDPGTDEEKGWGKKCLDALETIGKAQYKGNLHLIENYEMIKGRFVFDHYFHVEGYDSMLTKLSAEFEMPKYLRHYDIISQVLNTMSGEWQKRPDLFKVRQLGDGATNEYLRTKQELLKQWAFQQINQEIDRKLAEMGIDQEKSDFSSQEESDAYAQQLTQIKTELTPEAIQKYMDTDFLTHAEIWAQHQKEYDREYYNLPEKEKVEFEDMLTADRAFRHFYITPTGYNQETWNPLHVFYHKSPDVTYIEEGDYVGRIFHLSLSTIIDRYGHLMKKEDFELLQGLKPNDKTKWSDSQYDWVYDNYLMPFKGYPAYDIMKKSWSANENDQIPFLTDDVYKNLTNDTFYRDRVGYFFITEAYWRTQEKIIKLTYIDEETGEITVRLVDETAIIPDFFVESNRPFDTSHDINTYCETWVNRTWKGIKINTAIDKILKKDIYLGIGPNDFQFKGDQNRFGCKLPVCGQIFSARNSRSMSLVDMMKPYQIGYNVAMNQFYQLAEKEIGVFAVMDINMFPSSKDYGGEDAWEKWMFLAKNLGLLPADTSPSNIKNSLAATGGFLPKVIDLNLAGQMVSRMNMAKFFEEQALKQIGFNNYRLGNFSQSSTATGIEQGMAQSYAQTESYFTNFSNYLRRCYKMGLEMAQFIQSQKPEVYINYIKSDLSRAFIKVLGIDLMLADIGIVVTNSQEFLRQLEMSRKFAIENNTAGLTPPDVMDVIMMNSPQEIRRQIKTSYDRLMQQQEAAQQAQNENQQRALELKQLEIEKKDQQFKEELENNLDVAYIKAGATAISNDTPLPEPKQKEDTSHRTDANNIKREQLALQQQALINDSSYKQQKLALDQSKIAASLQIQQQQTETARILKGKTNKDKSK